MVAGSAFVLAAWGTPADSNPPTRGAAEPNAKRAALDSDGKAAAVTGMAVRVFFDACVRNITDEAAVRNWLQGNGFHAAPPGHAAPFLRGTPGIAWLRADPAPVAIPLVVVTRSTGSQCEVMAPVSDPETASSAFRRLITGLGV